MPAIVALNLVREAVMFDRVWRILTKNHVPQLPKILDAWRLEIK